MTSKPRRDKGSGSVRNRGTERAPRWFAYYSVAIPPEPMVNQDGTPKLDGNGKPKIRTRRQLSEGPFTRKSDAQAWLKHELAEKDRGRGRVPTNRTVAEALTEWQALREHDLSPGAFAEYRRDIEQRIVPHLGHVRLKDLTGTHIAGLYKALRQPGADRRSTRDPKGLAESSIQHTAATLHGALEWVVTSQRWLARNPADDAPSVKPADTDMSCWTAEQLGAFLRSIAGDRLAPVWRLACFTGLRRSELLGLRWECVDLDKGTIRVERRRVMVGGQMVEQPGAKSRRGRRTVDLDAATVKALKRWRTAQKAERLGAGEAWTDSGYVVTDELGRPIHAEAIGYQFRSAVRRADVPSIRFHDMRHTHATLLLLAKRPVHEVAARLGHTPQMCMTVYAHVIDQQGAQGAAAFAQMVDGVAQ